VERLYSSFKSDLCLGPTRVIENADVKRRMEIAYKMNQIIWRKLFFSKW
jgi:hypothetical protein